MDLSAESEISGSTTDRTGSEGGLTVSFSGTVLAVSVEADIEGKTADEVEEETECVGEG